MIPPFIDIEGISPSQDRTLAAGHTQTADDAQVVRPALPIRCGPDGCCIRGCVCVTGQDCPCCGY